MKKFFAAVLCVVELALLSGCSGTGGERDMFPKTLKLQGTPWGISASLGGVHNMVASDDCLVIRNHWDETYLTMVSLDNAHTVHHFGLVGDGPQYITRTGTFMVSKDLIEVYDGGKKALLSYIPDSIRMGVQTSSRFKRLEDVLSIAKMQKLQGSYYLSTGVFAEGRLCLMDSMGHICSFQGEFPISENDNPDYPFHVKCMAYLSSLAVQPHGNRSVLATQYGGIIQIHEWDLQKKTATEVARVNRFSPDYGTADVGGTPNFATNENTRWGYLSVAVNDDYIFALYSGKLNREEGCMQGNLVHVYDWDGKAICQLELDCDARQLEVNGSHLYVMMQDGDGENDIVEYQINL